MTQLASRIRRQMPSRLLPAAFFAWRGLRALSPSVLVRNNAARRRSSIPVPPNSLIFRATATREVEWFLRSGEQTARAFRAALIDICRPLEQFDRALDFGCGCGRVLRQWNRVSKPAFYGSDYNVRAVDWINTNLEFASAAENRLEPPLWFQDEFFDLCYSVSVFTHLPENLQRRWIEELHRVMSPGGILMLTLSGHGDFRRITDEEEQRFEQGELVVVDPDLAGTNMCGVYHPESYVRREWSDLFRLIKRLPQGAKGSPNQDLYIFERL